LIVLTAIESADITRPAAQPTPYKGIQYVDIPEFQEIGSSVGQTMAAALTNRL
jgi:sorbitol/mannitol transport system substrate-binding protein